MSNAAVPTWIFDASHEDRKGLVESFGDDGIVAADRFIRFSGNERLIRIVRSTGDRDRPHEDIVLTGATITLAVGPLDAFPTSGSSRGEYNGDDTGMVAVPYNATAIQMQAALNANPAILGEGGVAVTLQRGAYRVEWNAVGARSVLEWFSETLSPPCRVSVQVLKAGDADTREVKLITIVQDYWASTDVWTPEAVGSVAVVVNTQGAVGVRETATITVAGNPTSGKWRVLAPQTAVHTVTCIDNSGADYARYKFTLAGNSIVSGDYIDVTDGAGPVRIWFNIAATGVAPAAPAGGRLLEIASASIAEADLGPAIWAAVAADSGLEQDATTFGYAFVSIRNKTAGHVATPPAPGFITFTFTDGSNGRLDGTYFTIYDVYGKCGIWFNLSGITQRPAATDSFPRTIEVTGIAADANADTVAAQLKDVIDADFPLIATVLDNVVTVTEATGGARALPENGTSGLNVVQTKPGYLINAALPWNASASQLRDALLNNYDVTLTTTPNAWSYSITAVEAGEMTDIAATNINLVFPTSYRGDLSFATQTCMEAFLAAGEANELPAVFEAQYQFPGAAPVKFFQSEVTVNRSLIDVAATNPYNSLGGVIQEGSVAIPNGQAFVNVVFDDEYISDEFDILAQWVEDTVDSPPTDVIGIGSISGKLTTGYRVEFMGAPSNGNSVYKYIVRL